jgi:hypothetical protein
VKVFVHLVKNEMVTQTDMGLSSDYFVGNLQGELAVHSVFVAATFLPSKRL